MSDFVLKGEHPTRISKNSEIQNLMNRTIFALMATTLVSTEATSIGDKKWGKKEHPDAAGGGGGGTGGAYG